MKILITTCGGVVRGMKSWTEYALAKELVGRGHDTTVLTSSSVMKVHDAKREEEIEGIKVKRFSPYLPTSLAYMLRNDWDVINAHFMGFAASISSYAILRKKLKYTPVVHNVMGLYHDPYIVESTDDPLSHPIRYTNMQKSFPLNPLKLRNWFSHLTLFNSDIIGALTEWEKKEIMRFGIQQEKLRVMPIGVDAGAFRKKTQKNFKERAGIDGPMLLFLGQPIGRKGPGDLLKALPPLAKKYPGIKAVFAGYRRNEEIEKMCLGLGVQNNVHFTGLLTEEDKIAALKEADAFVFPTLYEGFGGVFLEAMAAGCPIVTTAVAGVPEIVKHNYNGLLVQPKHPGAIAAAAAKILENKRLKRKLGSNGKREAKKYDWKKVADIYLEAFEDTQ